MDFTFTDEQRMMAAALRELLDDDCTPAHVRAAAERRAGSAEHAARWSKLAEMGLCGVLAPESAGGLGLSDIDFVLLAEEAGRAGLPELLIEHAGVAVPTLASLARAGRAADVLRKAASGEVRLALLHPMNPYALAPHECDFFLVAGEQGVQLADRDNLIFQLHASLDPLRPLASISSTRAGALLATRAEAATALELARERGAVYASAELLGLAAKLIAIAVEYTSQRQQFGKPIGSYQAVKHHLANAQVKLEFARPAVYAAAALLGDRTQRAQLLASHAKLAASEAADCAARTAIQVHGAMGYSWEVDLHFFAKRAWTLAGWYGDRNFHLRRVQDLVLSGRVPIGPGSTFDRVQAHA
jgi:alkylation response protein AidB-like acyl-CoA dehydrogenase